MTSSERDRQLPASGDADGLAFACTHLQERFWTQQHTRGPQGLNVAMRWQVSGILSHAAAEGALQALARRHEILRTSFREVDGKLAQIVWPACAVKLNEVDLTVLPPGEREKHAEEIARTEALEPMLETLQRKGRVQRLPAGSSCGRACGGCDPTTQVVYEWTGGDGGGAR